MRLGNPALRRLVNKTEAESGFEDHVATYKGIYFKAALFALVTILVAVLTDISIYLAVVNGYVVEAVTVIAIGVVASIIPLIIIALVITFVPSTAKWLGFVYVILQGALIGLTALFVDIFFPGIAFAAFVGTMIVFLVALLVNYTFKVRISSRFVRGMMVAFISLALVQLVMFILSLCGVFNYTAYIWIQLIASALCIVWATLMLFFDLQNIDYIVEVRADKKFEWIVAFSLVTTLIYLYVEILEILVRLAAVFGRGRR